MIKRKSVAWKSLNGLYLKVELGLIHSEYSFTEDIYQATLTPHVPKAVIDKFRLKPKVIITTILKEEHRKSNAS